MYLCLSTITSEGGLAVQYFAHRASYCAGDGCSALRTLRFELFICWVSDVWC